VSPRGRSRPWGIHLALLSAQTGFALFPIFGKLALGSVPPFAFAALRVVGAVLILDAFRIFRHRREEIRPADRRKLFLYGLLGVSFNQILFILGLSLTTAVNTSILTATIPVFTLAAAALLGREKLTATSTLGIALASAGAWFLLNAQRFVWASANFRGVSLLLLNCLSYSLYLVLSRPILKHYRVATFTATVFRYGAVLIVLVALPQLLGLNWSAVPLGAWACVLAVIVLCTAIPYLLNSWALARTHASHVAFYVFLQPVVTTALAIGFLGERLTAKTALAALLIFAGLGVTLLKGHLSARPVP
jgi:drug/metabolite transporter (DMT)-like permease